MQRVDAWYAQSPDRGDTTEGVTVALNGSRYWLGIAEADRLIERVKTARDLAQQKESSK